MIAEKRKVFFSFLFSIQAWCAVPLQLGFVIAMVTGIHFVEAYLLNPAIYSANLHLHPLLVISTLVVAEHSLGVWGLLLAGDMPSDCSASLKCTSCQSINQPIKESINQSVVHHWWCWQASCQAAVRWTS